MSTNDPMTQEQLDAIQARAGKAPTLQLAVPGDTNRIALYHSDDVDALLAEVERLRALTTVDEDMVERAALAFYDYPTPGVDVSLTPGWDRLVVVSPDIAAAYRNHIRAALEAAHNPGMWS